MSKRKVFEKGEKKKRITAQIPEDVSIWIENYCEDNGISKTDFTIEAIQRMISYDNKNYELSDEDQATYERVLLLMAEITDLIKQLIKLNLQQFNTFFSVQGYDKNNYLNKLDDEF